MTKLGMKLEARDGLEYEFTTVLDLIHDGHYATVSKDRTGIFGGDPKPITIDTGKRLADWLGCGTEQQRPGAIPPAPAPTPARPNAQAAAPGAALVAKAREYIASATTVAMLGDAGDRIEELESVGQLTPEQVASLMGDINRRHQVIKPQKEVQTDAMA